MVVILSPHYRYTLHEFNAAELDAIRDGTLYTLATLDFESAPVVGEHCRFCPAALICPARRQETYSLTLSVQELPTGAEAARLLETVARVEAVCAEIKSHYKPSSRLIPHACLDGGSCHLCVAGYLARLRLWKS